MTIVDNINDLEHLKQLNGSFIPQIINNLETPVIQRNPPSIQKQ